MTTESLIERATSWVGPLWPLDRSVANNPLTDEINEPFEVALGRLGGRMGVSPWPTRIHVDELRRRGVDVATVSTENSTSVPRPGTMVERAHGLDSRQGHTVRDLVGRVALLAVAAPLDDTGSRRAAMVAVLKNAGRSLPGSSGLRRDLVVALSSGSLGTVLKELSWDEDQLVEELARHCARLLGWAGWAKWNDRWSRTPHPHTISREDFLFLSLSADLAALREAPGPPPTELVARTDESGVAHLHALESALHRDVLGRLSGTGREATPPRIQVITCIDVRSEPLRRILELDDDVETFGFAGFFGLAATVQREGEHEAIDSLPVILEPDATITGGRPVASGSRSRQLFLETFAELTHEPEAMYALAEGAGWFSAGVMTAATYWPGLSRAEPPVLDGWRLSVPNSVDAAQGVLRAMGLTRVFAPEIVVLGHGAHSNANTHYSALDCGACAGNAGGANAAALARLLNDDGTRRALVPRGIVVPPSTRFIAAQHDTTGEVVDFAEEASQELRERFRRASVVVRAERDAQRRADGLATARQYERYSRDWAQVRPEWGLAGHVAFAIGPRRSTRGLDLAGRTFLHSYDARDDDDAGVLGSILAGPVVVAQWINAAYYFSAVAPEVFGAGDKTLLNPVGDFAVLSGGDPDLRLGLPRQSLFVDNRPVHLPARLLVTVEAPREMIDVAIGVNDTVRQLVDGGWLVLVARESPEGPWMRWSRSGWREWQ